MWFNPKAEWAMTDTDYGKNLFLLPAEIGKAFAESQFADWEIFLSLPRRSWITILIESIYNIYYLMDET